MWSLWIMKYNFLSVKFFSLILNLVTVFRNKERKTFFRKRSCLKEQQLANSVVSLPFRHTPSNWHTSLMFLLCGRCSNMNYLLFHEHPHHCTTLIPYYNTWGVKINVYKTNLAIITNRPHKGLTTFCYPAKSLPISYHWYPPFLCWKHYQNHSQSTLKNIPSCIHSLNPHAISLPLSKYSCIPHMSVLS